MTQLQVEYQKLQEQKRANLANEEIKTREAVVKEREADLKSVETSLKEMKAPYEIEEAISQINLNDAHSDLFLSQMQEILSSIELNRARTDLTETEREKLTYQTAQELMNLMHRTTGIMYAGDIEDTALDWIGSLIGGIGKAIPSLIG